ncbi:helix-turn-helix domain-containing protein, partial [Paenibacillus elgii]|uniref:helix-turn-helix domain-containing protein n=1 Tax=Paenibacillus elgii TaxID=189691 RepID=UPI003526CDA2
MALLYHIHPIYTIRVERVLDVLNYMIENGTSPNEAAVIFNIPSPGVIRRWRSQFNADGID